MLTVSTAEDAPAIARQTKHRENKTSCCSANEANLKQYHKLSLYMNTRLNHNIFYTLKLFLVGLSKPSTHSDMLQVDNLRFYQQNS